MKSKKVLSLLLSVVLALACIWAMAMPAFAATDKVVKDGVVEMGDAESIFKGRVIYYPVELETSNESYPVIVWANGTLCAPALYIPLHRALAKAGFIVVASSELMSADGEDQLQSVDYIIGKSMEEGSVFFNKVDPTKIVAMGHSQGGRSTVNAASKADGLFCCAVSIAGSNYEYEVENLKTPTLFISGTSDLVVPAKKWILPAYEISQGPTVYAALKKAIHTTCCAKPEQYVKYAVQWIDAWANGNDDALAVFAPGGALENDTNWQDVKSKNLQRPTTEEPSLIGSAFSVGSVWSIIAIVEALLLVGVVAYMAASKKKKTAND